MQKIKELKKPYRFIEYVLNSEKSTCDHCGAGIKHQFICKSADNKTFVVGSTCIKKLNDFELIKQAESAKEKAELAALKEKMNKKAEIIIAENKKEIEDKKLEFQRVKKELMPKIEKAISELKKMPHPNEYFASKGKSLFDYVSFKHDLSILEVETSTRSYEVVAVLKMLESMI